MATTGETAKQLSFSARAFQRLCNQAGSTILTTAGHSPSFTSLILFTSINRQILQVFIMKTMQVNQPAEIKGQCNLTKWP